MANLLQVKQLMKFSHCSLKVEKLITYLDTVLHISQYIGIQF